MNLDSNIKSELMTDFETLISKIDFKNYRPNSPEFSNALYIGLMLELLSEKSEENSENVVEVENQNKYQDICDELKGAEKYLDWYIEKGDVQFKQMATDELRHAKILLIKEMSKDISEDEHELLKTYEHKRNKLVDKLM